MAPGFTIRGLAESMRGKMPEEFTRIFGKSAKDLPPIICKQYRWWENHLWRRCRRNMGSCPSLAILRQCPQY
jgi:hypothetical protein